MAATLVWPTTLLRGAREVASVPAQRRRSVCAGAVAPFPVADGLTVTGDWLVGA